MEGMEVRITSTVSLIPLIYIDRRKTEERTGDTDKNKRQGKEGKSIAKNQDDMIPTDGLTDGRRGSWNAWNGTERNGNRVKLDFNSQSRSLTADKSLYIYAG